MQNSKSIPPFFVGQEVVALVNQCDGDFKRGSTHIVKALDECPKCKGWFIYIGILDNTDGCYRKSCVCGYIDSEIRSGASPIWYGVKLFAPITPKFETIEYKEVLEKEKEFVGSN